MSLSGSGISNFSVVALTSAFGTSLSVANLALTAYLSAQALGVLAGGFIADMTRRHAEVAAIGYWRQCRRRPRDRRCRLRHGAAAAGDGLRPACSAA